jgi:23S rRNA (uracil1939-C5)-methyltransferase
VSNQDPRVPIPIQRCALSRKPNQRARPSARPTANAPAPADRDVTIERIGADGDGIGHAVVPDPQAHTAGASDQGSQTIYVPFTLPGDTVRATGLRRHGQGLLGSAETWLTRGPDRADPPCPHFGACGGCALQHWQMGAYLAWKTELLRHALLRAGFADPNLAPIVPCAPASRRRMDLAARRIRDGVVLGLHRVRSADVVDLTECSVLHPGLTALLDPLRALLHGLVTPWRHASVIANLLDSGPDLLLRIEAEPTPADRATIAGFARKHDLPRIAWAAGTEGTEPVSLLRAPTTVLSGVTVTPPPGAFLQASESGARGIIAAVLAALPERMPNRARIAECHAGCGTLTFALVERARVQAWEGDAPSFTALRQAANNAGLAGRVQADLRDLARKPVQAKELAGFSAVVLDPPHNGAIEQMGPLAASDVPVVIYVSCNPVALARDAAVLREGGYRLDIATPIDQFLWSPRLESVSVFRRDRR